MTATQLTTWMKGQKRQSTELQRLFELNRKADKWQQGYYLGLREGQKLLLERLSNRVLTEKQS